MLLVAPALFGESEEYQSPGGYCHGESSVLVNTLMLQGNPDEKAVNPVDEFYDRINLIDQLVLNAKRRAFSRIPLAREKGAKITMGQRVSAVIMNGLGFVDDRLYL